MCSKLFRRSLISFALLIAVLAGAEDSKMPLWRLDVGAAGDSDSLGFGWGSAEGRAESFRWVLALECDVFFQIEEVSARILRVRSQPLYLNWKQQKVGVFINHRYAGSWEYSLQPGFQVNQLSLPAEFFRMGRNTLTLRMGYRAGFQYDSREMALGVDWIELLPEAER